MAEELGKRQRMDRKKSFEVDEKAGLRIDRYLAEELPELSRSYVQKLIRDGHVTLAGKLVKTNYKVAKRDVIELELPPATELDLEPENLPLDILYEDKDVIFVNKPKGMVVHPAPGHTSGTLVNGLLFHCQGELSGINGVMRPGIVHRIDKDTTGVLIVCKNDHAHDEIARQLKEHSITRRYHAIVCGNLKEEEGTVNAAIGRHPVERKRMAVVSKGGKRAVTHYQVLERFGAYTYVECRLETGRTHQIRVHMASIGHPLLGDEVYGKGKIPFGLQGQVLHAMVLGVMHPSTGKYLEVEAPLPRYFLELLEVFRRKNTEGKPCGN